MKNSNSMGSSRNVHDELEFLEAKKDKYKMMLRDSHNKFVYFRCAKENPIVEKRKDVILGIVEAKDDALTIRSLIRKQNALIHESYHLAN